MNRSNTADNTATGKPFTKGDPRINRKGRPKSFDALRVLAQEIAHEPITVVNGHRATVAEMILRKWGRWQHQVDYRPFKYNKLILRKDIVIPEGMNNYGMVLTKRDG
jgi:hypothetical protein